ncbi:hypothetical protein CCACVL1_08298 [Corchorus capsularis]|uniref:Uncharacterized protein n=1 Tax=Corchorus capsularis TaxID=210143 RepID=A0A1R3J188_COCAP|nr:hypothetical protein CCACVL1_08298 [Corchorus capsularis]
MMDDIDIGILREIQRKLFLRQLELRLDCVFDRAISNFQRKLNQGLKELSNARVAVRDDAPVTREIEVSSLDKEGITVATNINGEAATFTQLQLPPNVSPLKPELLEPIGESPLEEPNLATKEEQSESIKSGDFIDDAIPATDTKLLMPPAATLVPIESSNAFLLEGPKLSTGLVVEPHFVLNISTQKSTSAWDS